MGHWMVSLSQTVALSSGALSVPSFQEVTMIKVPLQVKKKEVTVSLDV